MKLRYWLIVLGIMSISGGEVVGQAASVSDKLTLGCLPQESNGSLVSYELDRAFDLGGESIGVFEQTLKEYAYYLGAVDRMRGTVGYNEAIILCSNVSYTLFPSPGSVGFCTIQMNSDCTLSLDRFRYTDDTAGLWPTYLGHTHHEGKKNQVDFFKGFLEALREHGEEDVRSFVEDLEYEFKRGRDEDDEATVMIELFLLRAKLWAYVKHRRFDGKRLCYRSQERGFKFKCFKDELNVTKGN